MEEPRKRAAPEATAPGSEDPAPRHPARDEPAAKVWPGQPPRRLMNSELELLISGAVIFSMFRLPGLLQGLFARVEPRVSQDLFWFPFFLFYLGSLVVLTLIVCFSAHFLLRSFWVALVGLNLVFPEGIRWESLDLSPMQKRIARQTFPAPRELEAKLDKIASSIFSILFYLVLQFVFLFLVFLAVLAVAAPLRRLLLPGVESGPFVQIVIVAVLVPFLVASLADRWLKGSPDRVAIHPRFSRGVERILRFYLRLLWARLYLPIQLTFASHFSTRSATIGSSIGGLLVVALFVLTFLVGTGFLGFDSYVFMPERASGTGVEPRHYESLAGERSLEQVPTIQADVVTDPYVRLFIPLRIDRDTARLRQVCPRLEPLRAEGLFLRRLGRGLAVDPRRERETLGCLARVYEIELNGELLEAPELSFYRHPETGERGVVAYLATADLPRGRNLLVVRHPSRTRWDGSALSAEKQRRDDVRRTSYIPFWL